MTSSPVQRRIEKKLHYRFLRRLANNRPNRWPLSTEWRTLMRVFRRGWNRFWNVILPAPLINTAAFVIVACVCLGVAVAVGVTLFWVLVRIPEMILRDIPAGTGELRPGKLSRIAFSRLTILQSLAWIGIALVGLRFESKSADQSERRFIKRSPKVREQVRSVFFLSLQPADPAAGMYWIEQNGSIAYCADAASGELLYQERLRRFGQRYASPVLAGDRIYYVARNGKSIVLAAQPDFKLLAENQFEDGSRFDASPVIDGDRLLVRSKRFLYCLQD